MLKKIVQIWKTSNFTHLVTTSCNRKISLLLLTYWVDKLTTTQFHFLNFLLYTSTTLVLKVLVYDYINTVNRIVTICLNGLLFCMYVTSNSIIRCIRYLSSIEMSLTVCEQNYNELEKFINWFVSFVIEFGVLSTFKNGKLINKCLTYKCSFCISC